jgi:hypothetical protein
LTLCIALGLAAPALSPAQSVPEPWDVAVAAQNMAAQAARLQPLLDQVHPADWDAGPATATYIRQFQSAQDEVRYLLGAAQNLGRQPDKLSVALETYFRLQSVENQVESVADGVKRYQNQALGELMISVMAANGANRDQLRQYISDLALAHEQEFKVADSEAQRCRVILLRQPAAPAVRPSVAAPATAPNANPPKGSR